MNLKIEAFLEDALDGVQPTSQKIGRVVVEPDYEATVSPGDAAPLAAELSQCIAQSTPAALAESSEIAIPENFAVLRRYIRQITLHPDKVEGSWVEVAPPGNWI